MTQLFVSGGQSIEVSALASVLPKNTQDRSPLVDWLDLLAVQGTLKSLLQHHSSKASIIQRSAFFTVQLSHPYMSTGKTIALTRRTLVGKVMSLLLNMPSRLVITFLPRSKGRLMSWLRSPSAVNCDNNRVSVIGPHCSQVHWPRPAQALSSCPAQALSSRGPRFLALSTIPGDSWRRDLTCHLSYFHCLSTPCSDLTVLLALVDSHFGLASPQAAAVCNSLPGSPLLRADLCPDP